MGIYCVVCLNCLFILVHTFVRKGKERELWWVKFSFPSGYQWIQDSDSHKHDRELTLAAPWWARCAAPSPGSPPSEPLHVPPTLAVSSLPPHCQPGGEGNSEVECFFQVCLNARSRTGCFYIPLNWVRTYIFKLLECTKVSELRIYMICISNLIEPRKLQKIILIWKEVTPSVFPRVQQYASVSPRAVSRGRRSWTLRPPAAASGCSPSGANIKNKT